MEPRRADGTSPGDNQGCEDHTVGQVVRAHLGLVIRVRTRWTASGEHVADAAGKHAGRGDR